MNEKKWQVALKLSRFNSETQAAHAKVMPVLDYVTRLEQYMGDAKIVHTEDYILTQADLREDSIGISLSPILLKKMSQSFMDGYFAVPKVLEEGEA